MLYIPTMHQLSPNTMTVMPSNKRRRVDSPIENQSAFVPVQNTIPQDSFSISLSQQIPVGFLPQTEKDCERLDEWVSELDESRVRRLLNEAAILHSDMYTSVWTEKHLVELAEQGAKCRVMREEQIEILDFSKQVQGADRTINHRFRGLRASKQYGLAGEAEGSVQYDIKKIGGQIRPESTQQNKVKAVLALCRIGSIVANGGGVIGEEVRKSMGQESGFMDDLWSSSVTWTTLTSYTWANVKTS